MRITIVKKDGKARLRKLYDSFDVVKSGDIYVAVGGDGTFIKAAQMTDKPVLLIREDSNGSIGYHSDLGLKDLDRIVRKLKAGEYHIEHLSNKIEIIYNGKHYYVINEARLNNIMEEVSFKVFERMGKKRIRIYPFVMSGDGLVITSKMGSTAYNRSAGGPIILTPNVLCLTFLNADGPYNNPLVFDSSKEIEIEIVKYEGILGFDNQRISMLRKGDRFVVRLSEKRISAVRLNGNEESFADKLERKMRSRMVRDFKE
ncbi:MAG: NAD(+)/NADH kinase [Candidatus Micrarchaeota archaeon]|nr:NAD(+)/NADH kinase [Candidatus Micrarchaeota archaeon]